MPRGRQTRKLNKTQIERLSKYRVARGLSLPQLKLAMALPFGWETLKKALAGDPVWDLSYTFIAQWIDRYLPAIGPLFDGIDGKTAAAGEKITEEERAAEDFGSIGTPTRGRK